MKNNEKKVYINLFYSLIASAISIVCLQLFVLPFLSRRLDDSVQYGLVVTIYGLLTISGGVIGNTLNNVRLLTRNEYEEAGVEGDFPILSAIGLFAAAVVIVVGSLIYGVEKDPLSYIILIFAGFAFLLRGYWEVAFRLELNYKKLFLNNTFAGIGYIIGAGLYIVTGYWELIFLTGELAGLIYVVCVSSLWRESLKVTKLFRSTLKKTGILLFTSINANIPKYMDRIFLYPILGGEAVAILYAASSIGKLAITATNPIYNVMLSYFSRMKRFGERYFAKLLLSVLGLGSVAFLVCVFISPYILKLIYPAYLDQALQYIMVTTAIYVLRLMSNSINPVILKFANIHWQLVIGIVEVLSYFGASLLFMGIFQDKLFGFCIGNIIVLALGILGRVAIYRMVIVPKQRAEELADTAQSERND